MRHQADDIHFYYSEAPISPSGAVILHKGLFAADRYTHMESAHITAEKRMPIFAQERHFLCHNVTLCHKKHATQEDAHRFCTCKNTLARTLFYILQSRRLRHLNKGITKHKKIEKNYGKDYWN